MILQVIVGCSDSEMDYFILNSEVSSDEWTLMANMGYILKSGVRFDSHRDV